MELRLIKTIEIAMFGNIYLLLGSVVSAFIKKYISRPYDETKSKLTNFLQLVLEVSLIMATVYYSRTFVKHLPNPLEGISGFKSSKLKEMNGGVILAASFLMYMKDDLKSKIDKLYTPWLQ